MKVLLTGLTGYVGKRLIPALIELNYEVICAVRDINRVDVCPTTLEKIELIEVDFLLPETIKNLPKDIDAAYYLIHSMAAATKRFYELESTCARNFRDYMNETKVQHVVYLSGLINNEKRLSEHLASRKNVEEILLSGKYNTTVLRAGIIVGSGSASFEIIRDIVEKVPLMITPRWTETRTQPISIRDIVSYLSKVLFKPECMNNSFDIGGPEVLTYKEMLMQYAEVRGLKRKIYSFPLFGSRVSSFWLFFITSVSYRLATNLVQSMKYEVICQNQDLEMLLNIKPLTYRAAIKLAFQRIKQNNITSSWKDSVHDFKLSHNISEFIEVPAYGCYVNKKSIQVTDVDLALDNIWSIGGERGWYYANWLWKIRGFFDRLLGGVGLRRGRKHPTEVHKGEVIDFWRVLYENRKQKRFILFAEMKLPGEAWLEFTIDENNVMHQVATFRPKGVLGRFYWGGTMPFHFFIFNGMIENIAHKPRLD